MKVVSLVKTFFLLSRDYSYWSGKHYDKYVQNDITEKCKRHKRKIDDKGKQISFVVCVFAKFTLKKGYF